MFFPTSFNSLFFLYEFEMPSLQLNGKLKFDIHMSMFLASYSV